jgi:hypothetical protein
VGLLSYRSYVSDRSAQVTPTRWDPPYFTRGWWVRVGAGMGMGTAKSTRGLPMRIPSWRWMSLQARGGRCEVAVILSGASSEPPHICQRGGGVAAVLSEINEEQPHLAFASEGGS